MKTLSIQQGSPEWVEYRRNHFNASDAAAMLGISPYKTRAELLREYATGISREISAAEQARFDRGHELEADAREIAEDTIGEDLYPAVGEHEAWSKLSASFDGITMSEEMIWEHKSLNDKYLALADSQWFISPEKLPEHVMAQIQQQLLVSGAGACLFTATNGQEQVESKILPSDYWRERILSGWKQFEEDLKNWQPEPQPETVPEGKAPELLPALRVEATGRIVSSNLIQFQARALDIISGINTKLVTDDDFADAEKSVKWCKGAEESLEAAENAIMAQTADIDEAVKTLRLLSEQIRSKRLTLEKSVKTEKEARKNAMTSGAFRQFKEYLDEWQEKIGAEVALRIDPPVFGAAIRGLKTLASIKNALEAELLKSKAEADAKAKIILGNLEALKGFDAAYAFLWRGDLSRLAEMPNEAFVATINGRIAEHKAAEDRRLDAERERIRQEEATKLEAKMRAEAEAKAKEEAARVEAEMAATAKADSKLDEESREVALKALPPMDNTAVRAFLKTRDFGKEEPKIRAALIEFVKFCRGQQEVYERQAA